MSRRLHMVQTPAPVDARGERAIGPRRFKVSVARGDGSVETYDRLGGSSAEHTKEAFDRAGDAGVVGLVVIAKSRAA